MTTQTVLMYILYFFFYSAVGWLGESIYCSIGEKKIINRGFLVGPMCPIYGTGTLVMAVLLYNPFRDKPLLVFLFGMILCDIVEYFTSLIMEKLFNARWWDYTHELLNLHGRICFKHTLYWGVGSLLFVRFVHPKIITLFEQIPEKYITSCVTVILVIFVIDVIYSAIRAVGISKLKNKVSELRTVINSASQDGLKVFNSAYYTVRDNAESAYKTVVYNVEAMYDDLNSSIDKGNNKFNQTRDEIIWQAQYFISQFEEKVLHSTTFDRAQGEFRKFLKVYKKAYKKNFKNLKTLQSEIMKITEDIKNKLSDTKE
ncbi:MAG: hypothetical protein E7558_04670 [Ruminococcaceae bacterium]|nr:hypothetical protein [Oscillospiraceae bacterium]